MEHVRENWQSQETPAEPNTFSEKQQNTFLYFLRAVSIISIGDRPKTKTAEEAKEHTFLCNLLQHSTFLLPSTESVQVTVMGQPMVMVFTGIKRWESSHVGKPLATQERTASHVVGEFLVWFPNIHLFPFSTPISFPPIISSTSIKIFGLSFETWLLTQARRAGPDSS